MPDSSNSWNEWGRHVLKELERLNSCYDEMSREISGIKQEIAMLQVKSGIWGAVGGAIPVLLGIGFIILKGG